MISKYLENGQEFWKVSIVKVVGAKRKQIRKKGFTTKTEAQREEQKIKNIIVSRIIEEDHKVKYATWGQVVRKFEDAIYTGDGFDSVPGDQAKDDYIAIFRNHTREWYPQPFFSITRADLRNLFNRLKTEGGVKGVPFTVKGLAKVKIALNKLYTWVIENRIVPEVYINPVIGIHLGKDTKRNVGILTITEAQRFIEQAYFLKHPWRHIWLFALQTGMRNGELYALKWTNISIENMEIDVTQSYNKHMKKFKTPKNGESRKVSISPELLNVVNELRKTTGTKEFVLPRLRDWNHGEQAAVLGSFLESIGLRRIRFHDLRACWATMLLRLGVPLIKVQAMGGWKSLNTMMRYLRMSGVDIAGATDNLSFYKNETTVVNASNVFGKKVS